MAIVHYARFNIQLQDNKDVETNAAEWQNVLHDAAIEGYADDFEVFYLAEKDIVGVSIPYEDGDRMVLLEAGSVLGFCLACYEKSDLPSMNQSWLSLHDEKDQTIFSTM